MFTIALRQYLHTPNSLPSSIMLMLLFYTICLSSLASISFNGTNSDISLTYPRVLYRFCLALRFGMTPIVRFLLLLIRITWLRIMQSLMSCRLFASNTFFWRYQCSSSSGLYETLHAWNPFHITLTKLLCLIWILICTLHPVHILFSINWIVI